MFTRTLCRKWHHGGEYQAHAAHRRGVLMLRYDNPGSDGLTDHSVQYAWKNKIFRRRRVRAKNSVLIFLSSNKFHYLRAVLRVRDVTLKKDILIAIQQILLGELFLHNGYNFTSKISD